MSRAGHMLQDYRRLAGQIFAQMMGDDLRSNLETAALRADQHRYRLALKKICLPPNRRNPNCEPAETNNPFQSLTMVHESPPWSLVVSRNSSEKAAAKLSTAGILVKPREWSGLIELAL